MNGPALPRTKHLLPLGLLATDDSIWPVALDVARAEYQIPYFLLVIVALLRAVPR
jgi:hypothetical protein